jgi:hypothetical protein
MLQPKILNRLLTLPAPLANIKRKIIWKKILLKDISNPELLDKYSNLNQAYEASKPA